MIGQAEFVVIGMTVIASLAVLPAGIILWNLFALSRSTRAFIANTGPVRQLSVEERAALAFMDSRKNVIEVVFCKKVGIVRSCNDTYSMVDVSNAMKARWDSPEMRE